MIHLRNLAKRMTSRDLNGQSKEMVVIPKEKYERLISLSRKTNSEINERNNEETGHSTPATNPETLQINSNSEFARDIGYVSSCNVKPKHIDTRRRKKQLKGIWHRY